MYSKRLFCICFILVFNLYNLQIFDYLPFEVPFLAKLAIQTYINQIKKNSNDFYVKEKDFFNKILSELDILQEVNSSEDQLEVIKTILEQIESEAIKTQEATAEEIEQLKQLFNIVKGFISGYEKQFLKDTLKSFNITKDFSDFENYYNLLFQNNSFIPKKPDVMSPEMEKLIKNFQNSTNPFNQIPPEYKDILDLFSSNFNSHKRPNNPFQNMPNIDPNNMPIDPNNNPFNNLPPMDQDLLDLLDELQKEAIKEETNKDKNNNESNIKFDSSPVDIVMTILIIVLVIFLIVIGYFIVTKRRLKKKDIEKNIMKIINFNNKSQVNPVYAQNTEMYHFAKRDSLDRLESEEDENKNNSKDNELGITDNIVKENKNI